MPPGGRRHAEVVRGRGHAREEGATVFRSSASHAATSSEWLGRLSTHGHDLRHPLPPGLRLASKLPHPIFTPATKGRDGGTTRTSAFDNHGRLCSTEPPPTRCATSRSRSTPRGDRLRRDEGAYLATQARIRLVDGEITLIDEALTPDSSRYWLMSEYREGISPPRSTSNSCATTLIRFTFNKRPPGPCCRPMSCARRATSTSKPSGSDRREVRA